MCIKKDLALNNLQWFLRHKIKLNLTKPIPPNHRYYMVTIKN